MSELKSTKTLTLAGAQKVLEAAITKANALNAPMCIAVVDPGANLMAFVRMDGSKFFSIGSSTMKAMTAAAAGTPTGGVHADVEIQIGLATQGKWTNLLGGMPIKVNGLVVGAIGAGSGTGDQDLAVARAGAAAIGDAELFPDFQPMGAEDTGIIRGTAPKVP
jgi:uncharacterized protein GlcG (DUF336 family)